MTYDEAKKKVAAVAQKSSNFKIGVTSLKNWRERLDQSDYSNSYTNIEFIARCSDIEIARGVEKDLIDDFCWIQGNENDPSAGGTGSLNASNTFVIYVVYN